MIEKATFGAGCFWGIEEAFQKTHGVTNTRVGYTGGTFENPYYEDVCAGGTGHVEAVEVEFDSEQISYDKLLEKFWGIHSAIVDSKWKENISRQYESVIFYHNQDQRKTAEQKKKENELRIGKKISTNIEPASLFYEAEERHQNYNAKRNNLQERWL